MKKGYKKSSVPKKHGRLSFLLHNARRLALTATVAAATVLLSVIAFDVADDILALTRHNGERYTVTVSDISELPDALSRAGIIKHPNIFSMYISVSGKELQRTAAVISESMDYRALLAAFTEQPPAETIRIYIPKSASVSEIIDIFVSHGLGSREGFVTAINEYPFDYDFIPESHSDIASFFRLEGYLYPDTYDFYTGRSESYYINKLLDRFSRLTAEIAPLCEKYGITLNDAVTVASLIECSAGFSSSYEKMSAVIHNRLKSDTPLEIPASSVYGMTAVGKLFTGIPDSDITDADTPYNTYTIQGLPPSPICNPSREALLCAISPDGSKYFYFTTLENGSVLFARSLTEHRENLARNHQSSD